MTPYPESGLFPAETPAAAALCHPGVCRRGGGIRIQGKSLWSRRDYPDRTRRRLPESCPRLPGLSPSRRVPRRPYAPHVLREYREAPQAFDHHCVRTHAKVLVCRFPAASGAEMRGFDFSHVPLLITVPVITSAARERNLREFRLQPLCACRQDLLCATRRRFPSRIRKDFPARRPVRLPGRNQRSLRGSRLLRLSGPPHLRPCDKPLSQLL